MKEFNKFELLTIKTTAKTINPIVTKKAKIEEKINKLREEWQELDNTQKSLEATVYNITGYGTEVLVKKVVEEGKPTRYEFRYPDTIIPPELFFNEDETQNCSIEEPEKVAFEEVEYETEEMVDPTTLG